MLKEKLEFLRGPGGIRAAAYFSLKLLARIDAFRIVWTTAQRDTTLTLPSGWRYVGLYTGEALSGFSRDIIEQAAEQCGWKPERLLNRGGSLHLLLIDDSLAAQLSIEPGPTCRIDSPPLYLSMGETDTFLSHLYTWPAFRRRGAAQRLLATTASSLSTRNVQRIAAHVRATNVPSLAAFERAGWKGGATIVCTLRGQLLLAPGAARAGFSFRSAT
jgi:RimJ/RimL family protein N-acetyltransferase